MEKIDDERLRKELPFDLYGRYAIIRDIIERNRGEGEVFRVLDVGGRGNMLDRFLPDDEVYYLDPFVESDDENFIKGDGCAMTLDDGSFDWVTSADVFEHVPREKRDDFLNENIRVAKDGVILVAPFNSPGVAQAEVNANEIYKAIHGGENHLWLREHIENGLPDSFDFEKTLTEKGYSFQKLHNNRLFLWQNLIGFDFLSESLNAKEKERKEIFNEYYNTKVYPFDNQEPSYRKIYFIKKAKDLRDLEFSSRAIDDKLFLDVMKKGFEPIGSLFIENEKSLTQAREQARAKEKELRQKEQELKRMDSEVAFMKSSRFWKMRKQYLKMKNRYGKK